MKIHFKTLLLLALIFTLGACTNVDNVRKFSTAAKSLSTSATQGYRGFDDVRLQAVRESRLVTKSPVTPSDLERLFDANGENGIRLKALQAVAEYAAALEALTTKDVDAALKESGGDIRGSLNGMNDAAKKLGGGTPFKASEISVISGLFVTGSKVLVESKREDSLRQIIRAADPGIQRVSSLVADEFADMGATIAPQLRLARDQCLSAANDGSSNLQTAERRRLLELSQSFEDQTKLFLASRSVVADAARKMATAHATLAAATNAKAWQSDGTGQAVRDFVAKAKEARDLFTAMQPKS